MELGGGTTIVSVGGVWRVCGERRAVRLWRNKKDATPTPNSATCRILSAMMSHTQIDNLRMNNLRPSAAQTGSVGGRAAAGVFVPEGEVAVLVVRVAAAGRGDPPNRFQNSPKLRVIDAPRHVRSVRADL